MEHLVFWIFIVQRIVEVATGFTERLDVCNVIPSGQKRCSGNRWCCPDGYICTGTATCLSIGGVAGIAVGCLTLICILSVIVIILWRRGRTRTVA